ncbi:MULTISPECIES: LapA family protein [unclassified Anabaena]|uniref:LapA family protein n=1 Tax=unclassified Anabaena TaxID=2619674 RepID=UPI002B202802|nr:LapA family protein [Anabaena sp. UHCC 0399]MEA5566476.1 LapA family protein [Anabaena sp. UHCC 0399]
MAVIRLILLIAIMGGLTLLLVQNWSPVLSLVFLGMRSQPLPLAMWILFSTAAGAGTSLLITSLYKLSNYFEPRQIPSSSNTTSRRSKAKSREEFTSAPYTPPPKSQAEPARKETFDDEFDDWEKNSADDDWNFDQQSPPAPKSSSESEPVRDSTNYERPQPSKTGSQSGSTYSYSYREPKNTAAGKSESVYDADYRVIIPPYQPPNQPPTNNADNEEDEDWSFFEDDDSEDDKPRR